MNISRASIRPWLVVAHKEAGTRLQASPIRELDPGYSPFKGFIDSAGARVLGGRRSTQVDRTARGSG